MARIGVPLRAFNSLDFEPGFEYIKEYVETQVDDNVDIAGFPSKEAFWYHKMFKEYYPNCANITPNWLPKWCGGVTDPSARILVDLHE